MPNEPKFINRKKAVEMIQQLAEEYVIIKNPEYVHPAYEITPLAPKITTAVDHLVAAVMDMDGTTTTTETLCIHSLDYMVRKITQRMSKDSWAGLDSITDYPNIIGNSTTKHVEYLIQKYQAFIDPDSFKSAYLRAALWFLLHGKDPNRVREVRNNLVNLGCKGLLKDEKLQHVLKRQANLSGSKEDDLEQFITSYLNQVKIRTRTDQVRAAIDVYYQRYHEILEEIKQGQGNRLAEQLLGGQSHSHLIEPMPGIGIFIALIKGWLGEESVRLFSLLYHHLQEKHPELLVGISENKAKTKLEFLGKHFEKHPLKVAIVTSSIQYEAEIVLAEVFRVLTEQIQEWPISAGRKQMLVERFSDYHHIYDGFVTATDSSEIRLKPHRDLYSLALHQLGIHKEQFSEVLGFEDSESGTIAIRAAGIGLCLAVPFSETQHHDFGAASLILKGGLPETVLKYNVFLR